MGTIVDPSEGIFLVTLMCTSMATFTGAIKALPNIGVAIDNMHVPNQEDPCIDVCCSHVCGPGAIGNARRHKKICGQLTDTTVPIEAERR